MSTQTICPNCGQPSDVGAAHEMCAHCLLQAAIASEPIESEPQAHSATSPHQRMVPPELEELQNVFQQFEIFELVGQGGMGAVYRAKQKQLDRIVALKILPKQLSADSAFQERFLREAQALASLQHPNIVACHDFGQQQGYCFLVMEFVDGVNLRQAIRSENVSPQQALEIVSEICAALQYAHDEGIVHRDVKPENILLDQRGRVKIADFGLAKMLRRTPIQITLTQTNQVLGTMHYMAPEQLDRPLEVDHRADLYSLGVVFYELLTGQLPLGRFKLPSEKSRVDARLDEVVLRSLEREPAERYQYADQIKTDITRISNHRPVPAKPPIATPATRNPLVSPEVNLATVRRQVIWPARLLMVMGTIGLLLFGFGSVMTMSYVGVSQASASRASLPSIASFFMMVNMVSLVQMGLAIAVGLRAQRLKNYAVVCALTILLLIPAGVSVVFIAPFALWLLIVLLLPPTRAAFQLLESDPGAATRIRTQPIGHSNRASNRLVGVAFLLVLSMVVGIVMLFLGLLLYRTQAGPSNRGAIAEYGPSRIVPTEIEFRIIPTTKEGHTATPLEVLEAYGLVEFIGHQRLKSYWPGPDAASIAAHDDQLIVHGMFNQELSGDIITRLIRTGECRVQLIKDVTSDGESENDGDQTTGTEAVDIQWRNIQPEHVMAVLNRLGDFDPRVQQDGDDWQFACNDNRSLRLEELNSVQLINPPETNGLGGQIVLGLIVEDLEQLVISTGLDSGMMDEDRRVRELGQSVIILSIDDQVYFGSLAFPDVTRPQIELTPLNARENRNLAAIISTGSMPHKVQFIRKMTQY